MRSLTQLVNEFAGKRILVIGDVMLDEYLSGDADRMSPEAPVPIVSLRNRFSRLGGAANVAVCAHNLGAEVQLVGLYGKDEAGAAIKQLLIEAGVSQDFLVQSETRRTTRKARVLSRGQQLLRVDTEDTMAATPPELAALSHVVKLCFKSNPPDVVLFEDYDKGCLTPGLIAQVISLAKSAFAKTAVDPKHRNFWEYVGVDLFKPNAKEASDSLNDLAISATQSSLDSADQALRAKLNHDTTLLTLGAKGVYAQRVGETSILADAIKLDIADVCGAGDNVAAVTALAISCDASLHELTSLANIAGGLACAHVGVWPLNKVELLRACG